MCVAVYEERCRGVVVSRCVLVLWCRSVVACMCVLV